MGWNLPQSQSDHKFQGEVNPGISEPKEQQQKMTTKH